MVARAAKMRDARKKKRAVALDVHPAVTTSAAVAPSSDIQFTAREALKQKCRVDVHAFLETVLRDEETDERVQQEPIHVRMQQEYDAHRHLVVMAHPESGKSQQLTIGRHLWNVGHNPRRRGLILGNTQKAANKLLASVKGYIEKSEELAYIFPDLRPGNVWRDSEITVARAGKSDPKDFTIASIGYHGDVQGSRIDEVFADDLLDAENTWTEEARAAVATWWKRQVMSRVTRTARVTFITNAWHGDDLGHALERMGWRCIRFPVLDRHGCPTWAARWPVDRIEEARTTLYGPDDFERVMMLRVADDGADTFTVADIQRCRDVGRGWPVVLEMDPADLEPGQFIVTAIDVGASKTRHGSRSAIATGLFDATTARRRLLNLESGKWGGREFVERIDALQTRYPESFTFVENNSAQNLVVEIANEFALTLAPVLPFQTGRNKVDPSLGMKGFAAEMRAGRWGAPSDGQKSPLEIERAYAELQAYAPGVHTGDRAMAWWMMRTAGQRLLAWRRRGGRTGVTASLIGGAVPAPAHVDEIPERVPMD